MTPQAALISLVGSSVAKTVFNRARALGLSSLPARSSSRRCAQAGSTFIPRLPLLLMLDPLADIGDHLVPKHHQVEMRPPRTPRIGPGRAR